LMGAHIVVGAVDSAAVATAIADGATLETLTGADDNELALSAVDDVVRINAMVQVTGVNIPASNGIVHLVDSVILPSDLVYPGDIVELLEAYPVFSTLLGAVGGLTDNAIATALTLNADKTLFAPFNPAFEGVTLPDEPELVTTLGYHLLSGS